jgi:hypothetical protein
MIGGSCSCAGVNAERSPETPREARGGSPAAAVAIRPRTNRLWAELMRRSFGFDVLACPRCGDRLELIALIENPPVIRRILDPLGLPTEVPAARPARRRSRSGDPFRDTTTTRRCPEALSDRLTWHSAPVPTARSGRACARPGLPGGNFDRRGCRRDNRRRSAGHPRCATGGRPVAKRAIRQPSVLMCRIVLMQDITNPGD